MSGKLIKFSALFLLVFTITLAYVKSQGIEVPFMNSNNDIPAVPEGKALRYPFNLEGLAYDIRTDIPSLALDIRREFDYQSTKLNSPLMKRLEEVAQAAANYCYLGGVITDHNPYGSFIREHSGEVNEHICQLVRMTDFEPEVYTPSDEQLAMAERDRERYARSGIDYGAFMKGALLFEKEYWVFSVLFYVILASWVVGFSHMYSNRRSR